MEALTLGKEFRVSFLGWRPILASGMWPAVSGAIAQSQNLDVISNNLANVNTDGFKKDVPTFKEYLANLETPKDGLEVPRLPYKDKDFYPLDGRDQAFVVMDGTYTNFKQGNIQVTQRPLDFALDGPGFFEISTPEGVRYTRQGSLRVTKEGLLTTTQGYPVLSSQAGGLATAQPPAAVQPSQGGLPTQGGVAAGQTTPPEVVARYINLGDVKPLSKVTVSDEGEIYSGDQIVSKLNVVEFQDRNKLKKYGGMMYENLDPVNAISPQKTKVRQGVVESSNVNPIEEMTSLIKANRMFEHNMKALKTYDTMMGREVNDLAKP